ncbi:MAG: MogA/MoaB family molybdenum cofactor biosynthesis protein [Actinomycetaceae bacterium]|nr:MogA/MoaB family molybdenum cofactor biosynthesis protein [Actinomycetaceae bacterium]
MDTQWQAVVITISDRCASGAREDASGPLAVELLSQAGVNVSNSILVSDQDEQIQEAIVSAAQAGAHLVFTTGGTGISPADRTTIATASLLSFEIPGIAEAIRLQGVSKGITSAILSRGLVGVIEAPAQRTLVVNAPGSVGGVKDALQVLLPILQHTLDQLAGGDH